MLTHELAALIGLTIVHSDLCADCDAAATATRSPLGVPVVKLWHSPTCPHGPRARRRARIRRARAAIAAHMEAAR